MPWIEDSGEDRRSCELRYTIQATPEAADAPGAEEEKEEDVGLGGLFDDSPDSEAESEPGSQDLMSAAWVERMARNPGLQRRHPGVDLVSALGRLDLAERRQIISDIAVGEQLVARRDALREERAEIDRQQAEVDRRRAEVDRQAAEAIRRLAEVHANDQFLAGG